MMFTQQANQLQSALRTQFGNLPTAQDMIQALCNCAQTLEHRGPTSFSFSDPYFGLFPGLEPPPWWGQPNTDRSPRGGGAFPPIRPTFTTIEFPPWKPLEWNPIPPIDWPSNFPPTAGWSPWDNTPYQTGPQYTIQVQGNTYNENLTTESHTTQKTTTNELINNGDTFLGGNTYVAGDTYMGGDVTVNGGASTGGGATFGGHVVNQGDVTNMGPTINLGGMFWQGPQINIIPVIFFQMPGIAGQAAETGASGGKCTAKLDLDTVKISVPTEAELDPDTCKVTFTKFADHTVVTDVTAEAADVVGIKIKPRTVLVPA